MGLFNSTIKKKFNEELDKRIDNMNYNKNTEFQLADFYMDDLDLDRAQQASLIIKHPRIIQDGCDCNGSYHLHIKDK